MVVERAGEADVLEDIRGSLFGVVPVFAIHGDAVSVTQFEKWHDFGAEFLKQGGVVVRVTAHSSEAFKEIAVRYGPFPTAFAAEHTE